MAKLNKINLHIKIYHRNDSLSKIYLPKAVMPIIENGGKQPKDNSHGNMRFPMIAPKPIHLERHNVKSKIQLNFYKKKNPQQT